MSKKKKGKKAKKEKSIVLNLKLKKAKRNDFIQQVWGKKGKKNVPIYGTPYWMFNSKGEIENKNYILTEETDMKSFKDYLMREQILTPKKTDVRRKK